MKSVNVGDFADPTHRNQTIQSLGENYLLDGGGVSLGESSTSIVTRLEESVLRFGNEIVVADQQTVTHPDGDATHPRVDALTIDSNGSYGRVIGTPAEADPPDRRAPRTRAPVAPSLAGQDVVCVAWLWVPADAGSSEQLYNDYVIDQRISGEGLNQLDLIPGRDLQYIIDNAREGETLRGDRSQTIVLDQPLAVNTPNVTIEGVHLRYAGGAATSSADDMITLAADGASVEGVTLDGNKGGQNAEPDGITVTGSDCTVSDVRGFDTAGHLVNLNGGSSVVEETTVENVSAVDCDKDALILQGEGVSNTAVSNVRASHSVERGTVTLRNGVGVTDISNIYGDEHAWVLNIEDFGTENESSAPVTNTMVRGLTAGKVQHLLHNDCSDIGHLGLTINGAMGETFTSNVRGVLDVTYIGAARIQNAYINDEVDTAAVFGAKSPSVMIANSTLATAGERIVQVFRTTGITISQTNIFPAGSSTSRNGIYIRSQDGPSRRIVILGNNITGGASAATLTESGIQLGALGEPLDTAIVKNNISQNGVGFSGNADLAIIKDNLVL